MKVKSDKAEAVFDDGVLTLTIPKAEEFKPKRIKVKAKNKSPKGKQELKAKVYITEPHSPIAKLQGIAEQSAL